MSNRAGVRGLLGAVFLLTGASESRATVAVTPTAAPGSPALCSDPGQDDRVENGGFETGDLSGWNVAIGCCSGSCVLQPAVYVVTPGPENGAGTEVGTCGLFNYVACGNFAGQAFSGADWFCAPATTAELSQEFTLDVPSALHFLYAGVVQIYWNDPPYEAFTEFEVSLKAPGSGTWTQAWHREVRSTSPDVQKGLECFYSIPHYVPWTPVKLDFCAYAGYSCRIRAKAYSSTVYGWIECSFAYLDGVRTEACKAVKLEIYNLAGEKVRTSDFPVMAVPRTPGDFTLSPNPFSPDGDGIDDRLEVALPDGQRVWWDGKSDAGEYVQNGSYVVRLSVRDVFGRELTQLTKTASVAAKGNRIRFMVYDEAGNHLTDLCELRGPYEASDFDLSDNPFQPGIRNGGWNALTVRALGVASSPGAKPPVLATCRWIGDDGAGNLVHNGTYWVRLSAISPPGKKTEVSKSLIVLRPKSSLLADLLAYPNPYRPETGPLSISYLPNVPLSNVASLSIYDVQGARVARRSFDRAGGPDPNLPGARLRMQWDGLTDDGKFAADGLYVASLTVSDAAAGITETRRQKIALLRAATR